MAVIAILAWNLFYLLCWKQGEQWLGKWITSLDSFVANPQEKCNTSVTFYTWLSLWCFDQNKQSSVISDVFLPYKIIKIKIPSSVYLPLVILQHLDEICLNPIWLFLWSEFWLHFHGCPYTECKVCQVSSTGQWMCTKCWQESKKQNSEMSLTLSTRKWHITISKQLTVLKWSQPQQHDC